MDKALVREAFDAEVIRGDGHGMFGPEAYSEFFDVEAAGLLKTHHSDGTGKGTMFGDDGQIMESCEAVYNLSFLYWLARQCDVTDYGRCFGRGSQAREIVRALQEWCEWSPKEED